MEKHDSASAFVLQSAQERKQSDDSELYSPDAKQREHAFITRIHATNVVSGSRSIPTGIYVAVQIDGKTTKTSNKPVLVGKDVVEWDEEIILPPERSSTIFFKVYASFELGTRLENSKGMLLGLFKTTVGEVLGRHEELRPIGFLDKKDLSSCLSLRVITERRIYDINESAARLDLGQLTDTGHRALLRYQQRQNQGDLDEAIKCFQRVHDMCPPDDPNQSIVLFNLATAKFVHCQDNNHYDDLDVAITLYQDALQLRTSNQPSRSMTALDLCFALLARLQSQGNKADGTGGKVLLCRAVESYAYRAAWSALQVAGISVSIRAMKSGVSRVERTNPDLDEAIRRARAVLLDLPDRNRHRAALLASLGDLLYHRSDGNGDLVDIQEAILILQQAVELIPDADSKKPALLDKLGSSLCRRFDRLGDLADIDKSISVEEEAVRLTPNGDPDKPARVHDLGTSLSRRFERLGNLADMDKSISMFEEAARLTPNNHPNKSTPLHNLGNLLSRRFQRVGDLADIKKSISISEEAVRLTPNDHPDKPFYLHSLGSSLYQSFKRFGELAAIDKSISMSEEAVRLTPNGHPDKPARWNLLEISLASRFEHLGHLKDIDRSILMGEEAIRLTPSGHPDKPLCLNNLAFSLSLRFERLGVLADIDKSISMSEEAARLTPNSHPDRPNWLLNLGGSLMNRFAHLGDLIDINKSISTSEEAVSLTPNDHSVKPGLLNNLGRALLSRFEHLGDLADIDRSISISEEAVRLTPNNHPDKPRWMHSLGSSLLMRFYRLSELGDMVKSNSIFEEAVRLTPNSHPVKPALFSNLGKTLLSRFEQLGDLKDIAKSISVSEEAVRLTPHNHPDKPAWLYNLGNSLLSRFRRLGDLVDMDKSISVFEEAVRLTPNGHPEKPARLSYLGGSFSDRFKRLGDLADLEKSILTFEEAVRLIPHGNPDRPGHLFTLGSSLFRRFERVGDLADLDKSILMSEEAVRLSPTGHADRPAQLSTLGSSLLRRFEHLDDLADINKSVLMSEEAIRLTPDGHSNKQVWLNNLGNSLIRRFERLGDPVDMDKCISMYEEAVLLTPNDHPDKPARLNNLGSSLCRRFERLSDPADIDKSISMLEEAVRLTPHGHPNMPAWLNGLGSSLSHRFEHVKHLVDMDKSISVSEQALSLTPDGHPGKASLLNNLGNAFRTWFKQSRDPAHLSAATLHFSAASHASTGPTSIRFRAARRWISCARLQANSQALLDAYTTTINLLPQLAWVGLPLTERHRVLLEAADVARDAAAVAVEAGCPEMAVEWLEQGRSIVWSQFLQLRTPVDKLRVKYPALADQFQQISQQLEHTSSRGNDSAADTRPLEEEVQKHHDIALRRGKLLVEIRSLPDFDRFLLPMTTEQLTALANAGPVVYVNASEHRCDALIVEAKLGSPISVPLTGITYLELVLLRTMHRLSLERNRLIISRDDISALIRSEENRAVSQQFLDSFLVEGGIEGIERAVKVKPQRIAGHTPDDLFHRILEYLWKQVVQPVLQALGLSTPSSGTDKMARIFWCPTGPFAFLPIHAAGLYGTTEAGAKLSDFAISSYVPTLSALTPSAQKDLNGPSSNIHLTAVPQPQTDGLSGLVSVKEEIDHIRTLSATSPFVTLENSDGTVEDVMEKLKNTDWVHFACHGVQDPHNPLDSGLCLANGRRLKLSAIIRLSRPQGGLAFLSACQTAQGDEDLSEESVHLAAGMLLAGYGGVIATMWAIRDADAPKVTKDVYGHLFQDGRVPDSTEAAEALHYAVQHLRDSGASFTSWVPFIHVGR